MWHEKYGKHYHSGTQTVNVRKEPSADHEKLGSLTAGQKVTVTGQADTGWYRIDYNGMEGYVSDKYLSDQKVSAPAKSTGGSAASTNSSANAGNTGVMSNAGSMPEVLEAVTKDFPEHLRMSGRIWDLRNLCHSQALVQTMEVD